MPGIHFYFPSSEQFVRGFARIREEFDVAVGFPAEVERAAAAAAQLSIAADRADMRHIPFITIDPEGSRDLDQAYWAERHGAGYRVYYAIADVAHFIQPGSTLDTSARSRGITFYSPDVNASLHPDAINRGAASLLPERDRPAVLWTHDLDGHGTLLSTRAERAIVRSREMLSYSRASQLLDSAEPPEALVLLREIGLARLKQEQTRGGVSLRLPGQEIAEFDESYRLIYRRTLEIEDWNAQLSLLTGVAAAQLMLDAKVGLLRTLPKPEKRTLRWLKRCSAALGVPYPDELAYPDWVRRLDTSAPEQAALMSQAARAFRGAGYVGFDGTLPDATDHYAIGADYSHVTAPLRRLIDRFGNEVALAVSADTRPPGWVIESLESIPDTMMDASRRERAFEKALVDFAEALTLENRVGDVFEAIVTDVDGDRATLQIQRPPIVAKIDHGGLSLGDQVEVVLVGADPLERSVKFAVHDGSAS